MGEFGDELARWMTARQAGVRELARRSGYTASYISQLRAGKRAPSPDAAADLDDALTAGGQLAAAAPAPARRPGPETGRQAGAAGEIAAILSALPGPGPGQQGIGALRDQEYDHLVQALVQWAAQMRRRDILAILGAAATAAGASPLLDRLDSDAVRRVAGAAAGTRRADPAVAAHVQAVLDHCMRQEDTLGPQVVLDAVLAQQRLVTTLLPGTSGALRARLLSLLANICRFTGWVLFNLNDYPGAGYYYGQARAAAHEADDDAMCSMVLANWSQLATWAGDPRLGVEHALGAVAWGQRAGSQLLVSYGCDVGARAYAAVVRRSGRGERRADHAHAMTSLEQAGQGLTSTPDGDPGTQLAYFYDQGQYLATRTRCLLELGDPRAALAAAGQSLAAADPAFVRNVALTRLAQAGACAQLGEPEEACQQITAATDLACRNTSPRLIRVLAGTRRQLSPWDGSPALTALDERLRTLGLTA